jgi:hypothetical protein
MKASLTQMFSATTKTSNASRSCQGLEEVSLDMENSVVLEHQIAKARQTVESKNAYALDLIVAQVQSS